MKTFTARDALRCRRAQGGCARNRHPETPWGLPASRASGYFEVVSETTMKLG